MPGSCSYVLGKSEIADIFDFVIYYNIFNNILGFSDVGNLITIEEKRLANLLLIF